MSARTTLTDFAPPVVAPAGSPPFAARAVDAVKVYGKGDTAVHALDDVDRRAPRRALHRRSWARPARASRR